MNRKIKAKIKALEKEIKEVERISPSRRFLSVVCKTAEPYRKGLRLSLKNPYAQKKAAKAS